ncbi:MAG: hypothetical protein IPK71_05350 [Myxococcales bacterium]|nr:hypothetical protein [Myxococcales bacterium]
MKKGLAVALVLAPLVACGSRERVVYVPVELEASVPPTPTGPPTPIFAPDAGLDGSDGGFVSCAGTAIEAKRAPLPVDIVFMVDNSASMAPAVAEVQAGINAFAQRIGSRGIDYRVIMLSLRGTAPTTVGGSARYPICVPPPLGGPDCGNGPTFFHAPMDVYSTQTLEQLLGTLDQTQGYTQGQARGSVPWSQELRKEATKSIVLVTDDNSRFPGVSFEGFPGGPSPYTNGLVLPVGLLHPARANGWKGYLFHGIYGWGSTADPSIRCTYSDGSKPPTSGSEYSALVARTGGARAQLCDGPAAWGPFFDAVATAVVANARLACETPMPVPEAGVVDPERVNVVVTGGDGVARTVPRVAASGDCGAAEGWHYDAPLAPTKVVLCPASCESAQSSTASRPPKLEVLLGCASIVR